MESTHTLLRLMILDHRVHNSSHPSYCVPAPTMMPQKKIMKKKEDASTTVEKSVEPEICEHVKLLHNNVLAVLPDHSSSPSESLGTE